MEKFFRFVIDNKVFVLVVVIVFLIVGVLGIFRIYIDNDVLHWFSRDSDIARLNYYINEKFESNNPIIIMISFERDVFTRDILEFIRRISRKVKEVEGIVEVISLTEVDDIKSTDEGIIIEKLFSEDIPDGEGLKGIREYVMSKESYKGSIVSRDGKSVNIIAIPQVGGDASKVARVVRKEVEEIINLSGVDCKVFFGGAPMILNSISKLVVEDISKLVPIVSFVVLVILFVSFRTFIGTFIPLITVLISCAIGMGVMGYLGYPLTTFGVAIPVVLIAIGNAYAIHVINEYYERIYQHTNSKDALIITLKRVFIPVLMSGLTTIASLISIGVGTELNSTKNFSTVSSIGITLATLFTLTFVPAVLQFFSIKPKRVHLHTTTSFLSNVSKFIFSYRMYVLVIFIMISGLLIFWATKVRIEVDYFGYFDENTEPRKVGNAIADTFDGSFELKTYFKGNIQDPTLLKVIQIIEEEQRYFVGGKSKPQSIVEVVASLNDGMVNVKVIPETEYEVQNLWFFIEGKENIKRIVSDDKYETVVNLLLGKVNSSDRYALINYTKDLINKYSNITLVDVRESLDEVSKFISKSLYNRLSRAGVEVLMIDGKVLDNKEEVTSYIEDVVRNYLQQNLKRDFKNYDEKKEFLSKFVKKIYSSLLIDENVLSVKDVEYALSPSVWGYIPVPSEEGINPFEFADTTGLAKLFSDMEQQILRNQIISLSIIVFVVFIMNFITFGNFIESLISLLPILFTLIANFGIMGFLNIKMDFITVTIASIAVGVGIDYTIHFISRYVYEIKNGLDYEDAFYKTFSTTGKGILSNAFAVGFGFATLLLSSIVPLRNFGLMMFITMVVSSVSALTLLPIVMIVLRKVLFKL